MIQVETVWSIDDLLEANIALDLWDRIEQEAAEEATERARNR